MYRNPRIKTVALALILLYSFASGVSLIGAGKHALAHRQAARQADLHASSFCEPVYVASDVIPLTGHAPAKNSIGLLRTLKVQARPLIVLSFTLSLQNRSPPAPFAPA